MGPQIQEGTRIVQLENYRHPKEGRWLLRAGHFSDSRKKRGKIEETNLIKLF